MKNIIASVFALGLLAVTAVPASALSIHIGGGHHRHCSSWGWHSHHHGRYCRHW